MVSLHCRDAKKGEVERQAASSARRRRTGEGEKVTDRRGQAVGGTREGGEGSAGPAGVLGRSACYWAGRDLQAGFC